jgi:hypothetical protein
MELWLIITLIIPGFKDKCIFPGYERNTDPDCRRPHPGISVAESDVVALNFKAVASVSI